MFLSEALKVWSVFSGRALRVNFEVARACPYLTRPLRKLPLRKASHLQLRRARQS